MSACDVPAEERPQQVQQHAADKDEQRPGSNEDHQMQTTSEEEGHVSEGMEQWWRTMEELPMDFDKWMTAIKAAEQTERADDVRETYKRFLHEFPLCYGYWKRWADLEGNTNPQEALNVYERGLEMIGQSVDLWLHYITYVMDLHQHTTTTTSSTPEAQQQQLRDLFERAVRRVGLDWSSKPLWDKYIQFETDNKQWNKVSGIFRRIFQSPINELDKYRERFHEWATGRSVEALVAESEQPMLKELRHRRQREEANKERKAAEKLQREEGERMKREDEASTKWEMDLRRKQEADRREAEAARAQAALYAEEEEGQLDEEDDKPASTAAQPHTKPAEGHTAASQTSQDDPRSRQRREEMDRWCAEVAESQVRRLAEERQAKEEAARRAEVEWLMQLREDLYQATLKHAEAIWPFERQIRRTYFHPKPLESAQLQIWRDYLDFEINKGDANRITALFERCLVAANNYVEFWVKYANWCESTGDIGGARRVYLRGTQTHVRRRPELHLLYADFEESHGNPEAARRTLSSVLDPVPLVEGYLRLIQLERRQRNIAQCVKLYETALAVYSKSSMGELTTFLTISFARFLADWAASWPRGRQLLEERWRQQPGKLEVPLTLIQLEMMHARDDAASEDRICRWFEALVGPQPGSNQSLTVVEQSDMWTRYVDYLSGYGSSMLKLRRVKDRARAFLTTHHRELQMELGGPAAAKAAKGARAGNVNLSLLLNDGRKRAKRHDADHSPLDAAPPNKRAKTAMVEDQHGGHTTTTSTDDADAAAWSDYQKQLASYLQQQLQQQGSQQSTNGVTGDPDEETMKDEDGEGEGEGGMSAEAQAALAAIACMPQLQQHLQLLQQLQQGGHLEEGGEQPHDSSGQMDEGMETHS
ncbi:unnamed protein product [Vitrella brassicaformis CCMP3155]|uniref:Suppressor of forked domain-containing protein n=3 Tax=Vitrella brassicaformis TaxID=1169539 RepID=A0A0G4EFZ8_VITBC|nr:unnamed protein product [Vitrella brassicaformis CCMP3155]|eukprot:CEL94413.1 unnamed protein product [Vitrella brassicaformis CCMP3155]